MRDGRAVQLLYVSDLTVNPDHWNPKKEEIKAKALVHPTEKAEMNKLVCPEERTLDDGGEFFKAFDHFLSVHIYDAYPESRTPKQRGQNTINDVFTKLRTLFKWAEDQELSRTNPFKHFKVKVYSTDFSFDPALEKQRDIFVFQCLVGCRISDLYRMTKRSIIDGAVEYMPRKTKDGNPVVVRVPLLTATKEILDKYKDLPGDAILPLVSQQKYNIAIKKILKHAGIDRTVTWLNPTTGEPEPRPIYEVLSSHSARKAFAGNMYKNVKDPNLVCALTGHKEDSKAFNRYRMIDEETNRQTMSYLE